MQMLKDKLGREADGMSKVERYSWTMADEPGRLVWLDKTKLKIDDVYQRSAIEAKIKELSKSWSWLACGVIAVANRGGEFFVFDGQHRTLAALRRSDISQLPCVVFETSGEKEEAEAFLRANKNRKPLTGLAKFRAALVAEDADAKFVDDLLYQANRKAAEQAGPSTVRCLALLMSSAKSTPDTLRRIWPLIVNICTGYPVHEKIVEGLLHIENNLPEGESMTNKEWRRRAEKVGYSGLLDAANRFSSAYSKGGAKIWATGMIEAMNKSCRTHMKLKNSLD